ncbi:hypothetical protein KAFR_0K01110 [Kazachstania africana CBS 2517]|uniref:Mitochondrial nicotinamide adenine dinucleotide transporter 1 n=1 Tax=Kazachstania africana (strain ATCC 22294 / BCRC 22015 / CBS 2517 / CECT 1963 / NBRC 1671 / NRRL Y-8276) TaxID=1071382 RepID=H2B1G6_KAZAF|nr:hypothetical protein KAFR_0K01110 [Kazachstania africana CBS 2517]CCF60466.1 hypothetical protein KAFR_0K01110 [Kazachstania africana CBS 2517]
MLKAGGRDNDDGSDEKHSIEEATQNAKMKNQFSQYKGHYLSHNDSTVTATAGALAGFISGLLVCPLDVAKTRLQAQGLQVSENSYYRGTFGTISTIVRDEGIFGLYKGIVPIVLGYFPSWMIYFSVYEFSKDIYPKFFPHWDFLSHSCSAITAGAVSTTIMNPIWVVKTRLMLQSNFSPFPTHYNGTFDAFKKIISQEGVRVLYTGLVPSLFGLSHVAIHFPIYEKLKVKLHCQKTSTEIDGTRKTTINLKNLICASSASKMIASLITYPHEILRTRMQVKSDLPSIVHHKLLPIIRSTYLNEGVAGFYSGFTANLLRTVPASAITLVSFEYIKSSFK